jgi:hypothetical protein
MCFEVCFETCISTYTLLESSVLNSGVYQDATLLDYTSHLGERCCRHQDGSLPFDLLLCQPHGTAVQLQATKGFVTMKAESPTGLRPRLSCPLTSTFRDARLMSTILSTETLPRPHRVPYLELCQRHRSAPTIVIVCPAMTRRNISSLCLYPRTLLSYCSGRLLPKSTISHQIRQLTKRSNQYGDHASYW